MPQVDYNVSNDSGANVRTDLNNHLAAIVQHNSGASTPATTFAHQIWADTSPSGYSIFTVRNAADGADATLFDDEGRWKGIDGSSIECAWSFGTDVDLGGYRIAANALGLNATAGVGINLGVTSPRGMLDIASGGASKATTPSASADELLLSGAGAVGLTVIAGTNITNSSIFFANDTDLDPDEGRIVYEHATNELQLWSNNDEVMSLLGNTNVTLKSGIDLRLLSGAFICNPETITTDTTPTAANRSIIIIGAWTAANDITDFDNETAGQRLTIIGGDSDCNVVDGAPIQLVSGTTWNGAAGATLELISDGTVWYELSRSDAS